MKDTITTLYDCLDGKKCCATYVVSEEPDIIAKKSYPAKTCSYNFRDLEKDLPRTVEELIT